MFFSGLSSQYTDEKAIHITNKQYIPYSLTDNTYDRCYLTETYLTILR